MRPFEVTTPKTTVTLDAQGHADVVFSVSNVSGRALRANFKVLPDDPKTATWITVTGPPSFDFAKDSALAQVPVTISAPPGGTQGTFSFKLRALSAERPDDDFTDSPTVAFTVGPATKKQFPWWIVAVVVALIVIVAGILWWIKTHPAGPPAAVIPDVTGMTDVQAAAKLGALGFQNLGTCGTGPAVVRTDPAAGPAKVPLTTQITLYNQNFICIHWVPIKFLDGSIRVRERIVPFVIQTP